MNMFLEEMSKQLNVTEEVLMIMIVDQLSLDESKEYDVSYMSIDVPFFRDVDDLLDGLEGYHPMDLDYVTVKDKVYDNLQYLMLPAGCVVVGMSDKNDKDAERIYGIVNLGWVPENG